jgi:hypothetical protein
MSKRETKSLWQVAVNKLSAVAKSTTYPKDIIHVDFDFANWLLEQ